MGKVKSQSLEKERIQRQMHQMCYHQKTCDKKNKQALEADGV